MTPLPIEPLFAERPELFAHPLPSRAVRQTAAAGDWVKAVFRLPSGQLRPLWLEVESVDPGQPGYVGRLADHGYPNELQRQFAAPVRWNADHVYRLLKYNRSGRPS